MEKDILRMYGPDTNKPMAPRARRGGEMEVKPIPYSPPKGPTNIGDPKSPGLHGMNHGNCGTQRKG